MLLCYIGTSITSKMIVYKGEHMNHLDDKGKQLDPHMIERVQTGVRMEKRLVKVLKGLAEYHDMSLGDLLEGIVLHAFDGKCAFQSQSLARIRDLKKFYHLDLDSAASHKLIEGRPHPGK